jgi:hypothetical protein
MQFAVSGKVQEEDKWHMTGGSGWDLGEGEEKQCHRDHTHIICIKKPCGDYDANNGWTAVVAVGENDFGSFVSAGYLVPSSAQLILGRRYLEEGDARAKWSVEELYEKVKASDRGFLPGVDLRIAPWRTIDLHANKKLPPKRGKRKRGDGGDNDDKGSDKLVPALNLRPTEEFSSDLLICTSDDTLTSQAHWLEQCNGCGNEIDDTKKACICLELRTTSHDVRGCVHYCDVECFVQRGMSPWADAGRKWAQGMGRKRTSTQEDERRNASLILGTRPSSGLLSSVEDDMTISKLVRDAGWKMFEKDYHLRPLDP